MRGTHGSQGRSELWVVARMLSRFPPTRRRATLSRSFSPSPPRIGAVAVAAATLRGYIPRIHRRNHPDFLSFSALSLSISLYIYIHILLSPSRFTSFSFLRARLIPLLVVPLAGWPRGWWFFSSLPGRRWARTRENDWARRSGVTYRSQMSSPQFLSY